MSTATQHTLSRKEQNEALSRAMGHPAYFRELLVIDTDTGPRRLIDCLDPWQLADFEAMDAAWVRAVHRRGDTQKTQAWIERPKGHSKTGDIATFAAWALFASQFRVIGKVAAGDQDQAGLICDAIIKLTQLNKWLDDVIDVQENVIKNKRTTAELEIITGDVLSSHGETPDFVIVDELTHWRKPDLWNSLYASYAKRAHAIITVITNAGFCPSWQWSVRETARTDPTWHFSTLDGPQASWLDTAKLERQQGTLPPLLYQRLWLNQWTTGEGDAITPDDLTAACTLAGPIPQGLPGWVYICAIDLGLKRDATAIAVIGKHVGGITESEYAEDEHTLSAGPWSALEDLGLMETPLPKYKSDVKYEEGSGLMRLAELQVRKPVPGKPIEITDIEALVLALHQRFRFACVACDVWQARQMIERLTAAGLPMMPVEFVGPALKSMAEATLSAFTDRRLAIFKDLTLLADLRALRVVEKSYGIRLESPRNSTGDGTKHGDAATALAIGLHATRKVVAESVSRTVSRPLVCWP